MHRIMMNACSCGQEFDADLMFRFLKKVHLNEDGEDMTADQV